jgi:hypothetical protein
LGEIINLIQMLILPLQLISGGLGLIPTARL